MLLQGFIIVFHRLILFLVSPVVNFIALSVGYFVKFAPLTLILIE